MRIYQGLDGLTKITPGAVLSIGNFDGLHRGHQEILRKGLETCKRLGKRELVVVTFEPHPLTVLRPGAAPPRLTPAAVKEELLRQAGVDCTVVLPPQREVLDLTAEAFWYLLRDQVRPACLIEGADFNFGKDRGGTIERLREWTNASNVTLDIVPPVSAVLADLSLVHVSSTLVRWLIGYGRVRDAAICLGQPYVLQGTVVLGYQRGRTIGVPTANLNCADQLIPADGVYAGRCQLDETVWPAAVSIGRMPTFGECSRQVEAHLIGFDGDLYGKTIRVQLLDWLREQRKYPNDQALKSKMACDLQEVAARASMIPERQIVPSNT